MRPAHDKKIGVTTEQLAAPEGWRRLGLELESRLACQAVVAADGSFSLAVLAAANAIPDQALMVFVQALHRCSRRALRPRPRQFGSEYGFADLPGIALAQPRRIGPYLVYSAADRSSRFRLVCCCVNGAPRNRMGFSRHVSRGVAVAAGRILIAHGEAVRWEAGREGRDLP